MFQAIEGGTAGHTLPPIHSPIDEQLPIRLRRHVKRLKLIIPVISVSIMALRAQNAELDEDIASVLHLHASGPLDSEVDELEALLESVAAYRAKEASA